MDMKVPLPHTTLLILLGASEWPHSPEFQSSEAFTNAARGLKEYFLDQHGFGIPPINSLDLFNSSKSADEIDEEISRFLDQRISAMKASGDAARDVLVYFVGHGGFVGHDSDFYLAIRRTRMDSPRASGIQMMSLADTIVEKARHLRRIMILDCCFAAAAFRAFQTGPAQVAIVKTIDAFEVKNKGVGFPNKGMALLCSSDQKTPSLLLQDGSSTMFSKALLDALSTGNISGQDYLSLRDVKNLAADILHDMPTRNAPRPIVHSPDQSEGDIADIPFFPNPAARVSGTLQNANVSQVLKKQRQQETVPSDDDPKSVEESSELRVKRTNLTVPPRLEELQKAQTKHTPEEDRTIEQDDVKSGTHSSFSEPLGVLSNSLSSQPSHLTESHSKSKSSKQTASLGRRFLLIGLAFLFLTGSAGALYLPVTHWLTSINGPNLTSILTTQSCGKAFSGKFNTLNVDRRWVWEAGNGGTITATSQGLSISAPPGGDLREWGTNAPRLLQAIEGNFTASTLIDFNPVHVYQGAGILIWQDANNFIRLEHGYGQFNGISFEQNVGGKYTHLVQTFNEYEKYIHVRATKIVLLVQRKANQFIASWLDSNLSTNWQHIGDTIVPFQRDVMLGLAVVNTQRSPQNITAKFDNFQVAC